MRRRLAAIAFAAAALAACGGADAAHTPRITTPGPITTTAPPPLDGTRFDIAQHFWHDGFRVDLEAAEVWTSQTRFTNRLSYWLTLRGQFQNLGPDPAIFQPEMTVLFDGTELNTRQGDAPQVGAKASEPGELTFLVTEDFDFQQAELVVGASDENRARVPLGPAGAAVRLEPTQVSLDATGAIGSLEVFVTSAELRYDDPVGHTTANNGEMILQLSFDVFSRRDGVGRLSAEDFELVLADGSSIQPFDAVLESLAGSAEGITNEDFQVRFVIDEPAANADYALRITPDPSFVTDEGPTDVAISFTL
ncbi:MAG: hypothetical protein HKN91_06735 [Acidimicrobiia bacterium]|nr:hypothetical protein [Acidimicrobiia bacterium]